MPNPAQSAAANARLDPNGHADPATPTHGHQSFWLWVMCLTGVDYFSTLGYQPSIAFESAGVLAPLATVILILVTLFGALPVYSYVAGKSFTGQGSISMLERLMRGWRGKTVVLVLLGFAATDFVITKTLSAADAAVHVLHNPLWGEHAPAWFRNLGEHTEQIYLTMFLLVTLGASFMRGFKEVIGLAVVIVAVYLTLNSIIIGGSLIYLVQHGELWDRWITAVQSGDWHIAADNLPFGHVGVGAMIATCLLLFPKLALGLSGFETGVAVMPLVKGAPDDDAARPEGRIRNTRKLLIVAALIMSVLLAGSSLITVTLIEPARLEAGGQAKDRAMAYLAHGETPIVISPLFGKLFGTIYDMSTVVILSFAGASAMAGLLNLVPQYLPRYGMAPDWARAVRPLVILITSIDLVVTWLFDADVGKQGAAYATGVLVLITSSCFATVIDKYRHSSHRWKVLRIAWPFVGITGVFLYTTLDNIRERPDGLKIASWFIGAIVATSFFSRMRRSTELRFTAFQFVDSQSRFLWDSMKLLEFPILVPHRPGRRGLDDKEQNIREMHRLGPEVPIVFVEARLGDTSEFHQSPIMEVLQQEDRFIMRVENCASIAHMVAIIALELSRFGAPPEIHFGWSDESPLAASASFFLFGEGNVPWMVRELIRKQEPNPDRRPRVVVG